VARPPTRTFCAKLRACFLSEFRFHLAEEFGNEVYEYPRARDTPLIRPIEKIYRGSVPHLPVQEHWHELATLDVRANREIG
jgi:hypothetical protein